MTCSIVRSSCERVFGGSVNPSSSRERSHAPVVAIAAQRVLELSDVQVAQRVRLLDRLEQAPAPDLRREVDERAGDRGDRDPVDLRDGVGGEGRRHVEADPRTGTGPTRHADVDQPLRGRKQLPLRGGAGVAERRAAAVRQHRRQPVAGRRECVTADRVDAAMHTKQTAAAHPVGDRVRREPEGTQLGRGHQPVPTRRDGEEGALAIRRRAHPRRSSTLCAL
jgi:hypothetical protein